MSHSHQGAQQEDLKDAAFEEAYGALMSLSRYTASRTLHQMRVGDDASQQDWISCRVHVEQRLGRLSRAGASNTSVLPPSLHKGRQEPWLQGTPCESTSDPDTTLSAGLTGFSGLQLGYCTAPQLAVSLEQQTARSRATFSEPTFKVPKCEIFDRSDFHDCHSIKPFWVGDFGAKI